MSIDINSTIGWIGTGVMGESMCAHLLNAGYKVHVHNRTKSKTLKLIDKGAVWQDSPAEVSKRSEVVFTIVGYPQDVREVYFSDTGIFAGLNKGSFLIDMTTTEPSLAVEIYNKAKEIGSAAIDAPVSGGDIGAKQGMLSIMVGGDKFAVDLIMPLFEIMGRYIVYQGQAGAGQHTKMCNQIAVAGVMVSTCETLLYAHKAGLDIETVLSSITKGAATSWTLENLAPRIVKRDFGPGFYVEHFIKDMKIALDESKRMGIKLHGLELVYKLYDYLQKLGHGKSGTQALILALEKL
ncbi:MAG: NAD(P)-dependent oxidoreductase [Candidatus Dadabacteria bacterium]|nr:NAD(P)-dependent oxidoreductase [Candidatus Dadabacteria bacterium]NIS07648.1 NAD(P)-dependent oxidoreductase [Candidatus Dadabacteria bacterium]NIV42119.1 NAD-binding protein [Candidatus Dadabacteria bacterium]NIX14743.1 NAD-binding protein [Candidatus Dadabacteria bacterium]NIY21286.1 NAD-binding protein [Candidatus Dadabacteria bacterium]